MSSRRAQDAGVERALVILEAGNATEAAQAARVERAVARGAFVDRRPSAPGARVRRRSRARRRRSCASSLRATPSARAVGEIGLDYHYDFSPRDVQQAVFRAQVRLARELRSAGRHPHARGRRGHDARFCARRAAASCAACCTVSPATPRWRDAGLGARLLHLAGRHHDVSEGRPNCARRPARVPLDRLLTETDSPFLAPVPHRGQAERAGPRRARGRRRWPSCTGCRPATWRGGRPRISTRLFRP